MKILVAVDGSPFTKRMLGYLAAHDAQSDKSYFGHALVLMTVFS